jgi:hypothetical protein
MHYRLTSYGRPSPKQLVAAYAEWVEERVALGFMPTMLTFMFNELSGSSTARQSQMFEVVERTYRRALTRSHRRPDTAGWMKLPLWIGCIDWPIHKRFKDHYANIAINDGAHVHMLALDPPDSRLARRGITLEQEISDNGQRLYYDSEPALHRIHSLTITDDVGYVADYALKALKTGRTNVEDVLILPRAKAERT